MAVRDAVAFRDDRCARRRGCHRGADGCGRRRGQGDRAPGGHRRHRGGPRHPGLARVPTVPVRRQARPGPDGRGGYGRGGVPRGGGCHHGRVGPRRTDRAGPAAARQGRRLGGRRRAPGRRYGSGHGLRGRQIFLEVGASACLAAAAGACPERMEKGPASPPALLALHRQIRSGPGHPHTCSGRRSDTASRHRRCRSRSRRCPACRAAGSDRRCCPRRHRR